MWRGVGVDVGDNELSVFGQKLFLNKSKARRTWVCLSSAAALALVFPPHFNATSDIIAREDTPALSNCT